jgi:hypothetical protein
VGSFSLLGRPVEHPQVGWKTRPAPAKVRVSESVDSGEKISPALGSTGSKNLEALFG